MEDYPRTLAEFEARFASEEACRAYLVRLRWPDGFRCPACGGAKTWPMRSRPALVRCASCRRQASVTAGTIFQDSRTPLTTWFRAMWWVTSQRTGVSAKGLQEVLGLGSYETAWTWLHKLRRAMVRPGRDRLRGRVEVDETYLGGVEEGGTQGAVSHAHLDYYLDEFTFRFNRRTSRHRGKLFYRLVEQAVAVDPAPYTSLVKHVQPARRQRRRRHHN